METKRIKNAVGHLKTVCTHKKYVFINCLYAGMPIRGLLHDLSKFSPTEFLEGVKYYQGTRSPIDACKEENGYSEAWMHHKGRNRHHYEYWQDSFDKGGIPLQMPFKDAHELVCDYLGAGNHKMLSIHTSFRTAFNLSCFLSFSCIARMRFLNCSRHGTGYSFTKYFSFGST